MTPTLEHTKQSIYSVFYSVSWHIWIEIYIFTADENFRYVYIPVYIYIQIHIYLQINIYTHTYYTAHHDWGLLESGKHNITNIQKSVQL